MTPTPRDGGEGGLLAAAAAFFTHQGHEIFRDSCPDLAAYRRAGRITSTIVDVDRLPDHILSAGLDLLASFPPSSAGDTLGMSFMADYLPVPPPPTVSRVDPAPLSPSFLGESGGAFTPSDRRLSRFSTSLRKVCVRHHLNRALRPVRLCLLGVSPMDSGLFHHRGVL